MVSKRICATAVALLLTASLSVSANATTYTPPNGNEEDTGQAPTLVQQSGDGFSSITIYDGVSEVQTPQFTGELENSFQLAGNPDTPKIFPFEITNVDEMGVMLVVKSYEVPASTNPETLIELDIERGGLYYEARDILQKKLQGSTDERQASKRVTVNSDSKDKTKILALLDETTPYHEGGYEGTLTLDPDSILTEASSTSGYSYPVTETKEYTGLTRNDPSLVEKSITKNGMTLNMSHIEWIPMGSTVNGDSIISTYKAVVSYTGTGYGTKDDGYIVTATYKGTVYKEVTGDYIYSIIYAPAKDQTPPALRQPEGTATAAGSKPMALPSLNLSATGKTILLIALLSLLVIGIVVAIVMALKRRSKTSPGADDENFFGESESPCESDAIESMEAPEADEEGYPTPEPENIESIETPEADIEIAPPHLDPDEIDGMSVYVPADESTISISADGDPELGELFEGATPIPTIADHFHNFGETDQDKEELL